MESKRTCSICGDKHFGKGLCRKHYNAQWYLENKYAVIARTRGWAKNNRDKRIKARRIWVANNYEKQAATKEAWRKKNQAVVQARARARISEDPNKTKKYFADYYQTNKEKAKINARLWKRSHQDAVRAMNAKSLKKCSARHCAAQNLRRANKLNATPAWANEFFISEAYALARLRTKMFGFKWHVDHIVPLKSDLVCGLHVEHNLRVIPATQNLKKRNLYWPDMP